MTVEGGIEFKIWDDGPVIDEDACVNSGLGQILVDAFVKKLDGVLTRTSGQEETRYILAIPYPGIS